MSHGIPRDLRRDLAQALPQEGWQRYLLANLGFAATRQLGGNVLVRFQPRCVSEPAFLGMLRWVCDQSAPRVIAEVFEADGATVHIFSGAAAAARRNLIHLYEASDRPDRIGVILQRPRSAAALPPQSPLRHALRYWAETVGRYEPQSLHRMLSQTLCDRFTLLRNRRGSDSLIIDEFGAGMPDCAKTWLSRSLGRRFDDQPDIVYGRSCSIVYLRAAAQGTPVIEDVDAVVRWPGYGAIRRRYQRLILPFDGIAGQTYLLGATLADDSIDLRRGVG